MTIPSTRFASSSVDILSRVREEKEEQRRGESDKHDEECETDGMLAVRERESDNLDGSTVFEACNGLCTLGWSR